MKHVALIAVALIALLAMVHFGRDGDTVNLYVTGRDVTAEFASINATLNDSPRFELVDSPFNADITIEFADDIGDSTADAHAFVDRGHIEVATSAPVNSLQVILIHELLHCAGVGHEPNDPASVMHTHTKPAGQLYPRHRRALRRLAGATFAERLIANFTTLF